MTEEAKEKAVNALVLTAGRVLKAFQSGKHPTFEQLAKLQGALFPFTNDKLCGHRISEECDCAEDYMK